jgi:hypothetical protein
LREEAGQPEGDEEALGRGELMEREGGGGSLCSLSPGTGERAGERGNGINPGG